MRLLLNALFVVCCVAVFGAMALVLADIIGVVGAIVAAGFCVVVALLVRINRQLSAAARSV